MNVFTLACEISSHSYLQSETKQHWETLSSSSVWSRSMAERCCSLLITLFMPLWAAVRLTHTHIWLKPHNKHYRPSAPERHSKNLTQHPSNRPDAPSNHCAQVKPAHSHDVGVWAETRDAEGESGRISAGKSHWSFIHPHLIQQNNLNYYKDLQLHKRLLGIKQTSEVTAENLQSESHELTRTTQNTHPICHFS